MGQKFDPNKLSDYSRDELLAFYKAHVQAGRQNLTGADLNAGVAHLNTSEQIRFRYTSLFGPMPLDVAVRLSSRQ